MAFRTVDITLTSARDLNDVNLFSKSKVYAVAWIQGYNDKKKSPIDKENGTNPTWNYPIQFMVEESSLLQGRLVLEVELRTVGTFGDKAIGRVSVLLKDFVKTSEEGALKPRPVEYVSYQVRKPSGKPKGTLNFSVKIGDRTEGSNSSQPSAPFDYSKANVNGNDGGAGNYPYPPPPATYKGDEPVTAYPMYTPGPSNAYPPPAGGPSYGGSYPPPPPPPPHGPQGYPPPPHGYPPPQYQGYPPQGYPPQGYPPQYQGGYPQVQQPPKKNRFGGMGLGAGLLGGALGGLLIGDMIGDSGGFDGGFDDGGGFDF